MYFSCILALAIIILIVMQVCYFPEKQMKRDREYIKRLKKELKLRRQMGDVRMSDEEIEKLLKEVKEK